MTIDEIIEISAERDEDHPSYMSSRGGLRKQYEIARQEAIDKGANGFTIFYLVEDSVVVGVTRKINFKILKAVFGI